MIDANPKLVECSITWDEISGICVFCSGFTFNMFDKEYSSETDNV